MKPADLNMDQRRMEEAVLEQVFYGLGTGEEHRLDELDFTQGYTRRSCHITTLCDIEEEIDNIEKLVLTRMCNPENYDYNYVQVELQYLENMHTNRLSQYKYLQVLSISRIIST